MPVTYCKLSDRRPQRDRQRGLLPSGLMYHLKCFQMAAPSRLKGTGKGFGRPTQCLTSPVGQVWMRLVAEETSRKFLHQPHPSSHKWPQVINSQIPSSTGFHKKKITQAPKATYSMHSTASSSSKLSTKDLYKKISIFTFGLAKGAFFFLIKKKSKKKMKVNVTFLKKVKWKQECCLSLNNLHTSSELQFVHVLFGSRGPRTFQRMQQSEGERRNQNDHISCKVF